MSENIKISMVFIGGIIGAGFASGQEIFQYFVVYGKHSVFYFIFACFIMCLISCAALKSIFCVKGKFSKFIVIANLVISYIAMLSACGALVNELFNLPYFIGVFILNIMCFYTVTGGKSRVMNSSTILIPFVIIVILIAYFSSDVNPVYYHNNNSGVIPSMLWYIGYNSIMIIPLMNSLKAEKMNMIIIFFLEFICITVLGIIIWLFTNNLCVGQIPIINLITENLRIFYACVLVLCVFTTAVADFYSIINIKKQNANWLIIIGFVAGNIKLDWIVKNMYSLMGVMGIILLIKNIAEILKMSNSAKNRVKKRIP